MFATTRSAIGSLSLAALVAVPFATLACGGGEKKREVIVPTETTPTQPVSTVEPSAVQNVRLNVRNVGGMDVSTPKTGDAAYTAGNYRAAAEMFKEYVDSKPGDAHGYHMLGLSTWKIGDFAAAKIAFDKSIELNPKYAKSYFNEARVLLDMKRAPEALELIEKGRAIDSTIPDGVRLKARAQSEGGDVEGAMKTYRDLLVRDDADTWGLNNLGVLLLNRGEVEDALGPLARVVQVQPRAPLFQNNFGMALERSGHKGAALKHYEEAVRNDSSFTKAVKNVERLKGVTGVTAGDDVNEEKLAEAFRQKVKSWKDDVPKGTVKPAEPR